jgi:hypothetical protein
MVSFPRLSLLLSSLVMIGIGSLTLPVGAQQIANPSPAVNATNVNSDSAISAAFRPLNGVTLVPGSLKVLVDGKDVTRDSVITEDFFSYRPTQPFSPGSHEVILEFTNSQNLTRRVKWNFTVGSPIKAIIEAVDHNAGNRPLAAGENFLITVIGTPSSQVSLFLIQEGKPVQTLKATEILPGTYVADILVQAKDTYKEGILVARLQNGTQVRFGTADQPVRLVEGATTTTQTLPPQAIDVGTSSGFSLQPTLLNYKDGDSVSGSTFVLQGTTAPNATVRIRVSAENTAGGVISVQRSIADVTVQADSQGRFNYTVRPAFIAVGSVYQLSLTGSLGGQNSPTVTLKLVQR